jgi:hypothetical protein
MRRGGAGCRRLRRGRPGHEQKRNRGSSYQHVVHGRALLCRVHRGSTVERRHSFRSLLAPRSGMRLKLPLFRGAASHSSPAIIAATQGAFLDSAVFFQYAILHRRIKKGNAMKKTLLALSWPPLDLSAPWFPPPHRR